MKCLLSFVLIFVCLGENGLPIEAATESANAGNRLKFGEFRQRPVADRNHSFGDSLLQFSKVVRERNVSALGQWFHHQVHFTSWPQPRALNPHGDLIVHSRGLSSNVRALIKSREVVLKSWASFLGQFRSIDAVRFAVVEPVYVGENPVCVEDAQLRFVLVGTDLKGCRFWVSGAGRIDADLSPGAGWRFSGFQVDRLDEYRCPPGLLAGKIDAVGSLGVHTLTYPA